MMYFKPKLKIMKKFLVILLMFVFAAGLSDSQAQTRRTVKMKPYFMASVYSGINFATGGDSSNINSDVFGPFANVGVDLAYHFQPNFAIYADVSYNFLSRKDDAQSPNTTYSGQSILEGYGGPRFLFGMANAKVRPFVELGVGVYRYMPGSSEVTSGGSTIKTEISGISQIGVNGGAGVYVNLNKNLNLFARAKYHMMFEKSDAEFDVTTSGSPIPSQNQTSTITADIESGSYVSVNVGLGIKF